MPNIENLQENMNKAIADAELELQDYPIMPEHYSTMLKHPNLDATGYYSELDFEIAARLKRCDTYIQTQGMLDKAMYEHVRGEIETKGQDLKTVITKLSKQHRILTRAARICQDPAAKEELMGMADSLKNSYAIQQYHHLITGLEHYAGMHRLKPCMPKESIEALNNIGYLTDGEICRADYTSSERLKSVPSEINIEMRNMDHFMEQVMQSHPSFKEKGTEEKEKLKPTKKIFDMTASSYTKDACKDTLDALAGDLEERMDLLIINGETLREMIKRQAGKKNPTKEQIDTLSCEYVTAALKSGGSVEVFTPHFVSSTSKTYRPEPVVLKGSEPKERVTLTFWEKWLGKLGFFKEKYNQYQLQQKMDACRERVKQNLAFEPATKKGTREDLKSGNSRRIVKNALTESEKKEQQNRQKIMEKYKGEYINAVRMREKIRGVKDALTYSFFGDFAENGRGVTINHKFDANFNIFRDIPLYYAVAQMLKKGHSLKDVLDHTKLGNERAKIGREFKNAYEVMSAEEIAKLHVESMQAMAKEIPALVEEMSQVIKTKQDLRDNAHKYYVACVCINVPHMDHKKRDAAVAYCGGEKAYDDLIEQLSTADTFYGLKDLYDVLYKNYHAVLDGGQLRAEDMLNMNLQEEVILTGLRGKEPSLAPKMKEYELALLKNSMKDNPEVKKFQEQLDNLDEKMVDDVLKKGESDSLDLKIKVGGEMLKTTEDFAVIPAGFEFAINPIINGQKMLKMEEPVMEKMVIEEEELDVLEPIL